ncbi:MULTISPECIES: hypothetical protein [Haloarcula]|nr:MULTISPECIES: hypothetical protein [Haloarcula]NHN65409.1 hypothetical protein [Haloarcula sp. JP-Z28]
MSENCNYCRRRSSNEFVFPDGTGEPIDKWCAHPTSTTQPGHNGDPEGLF